MANQWLRLWHDMPTDPKWRTISKVSGQRIGDVIAVFTHMLVCASNATERGRTQSFNCEDVASALDIDTEQVSSIVDAMQSRVLDGDTLKGWEIRQVFREDGGAERAKAWREAKKASIKTQPNATVRKRTPDKDTDKKEANASVARTSLPTCPTQSVVDMYHAALPEMPAIRLMNDQRRKAISSFWKFVLTSKRTDGTPRAETEDHALTWIRDYFERARDNDFLMGRGQKVSGHEGWQCDLDFLLTEKGKKFVIEKTREDA